MSNILNNFFVKVADNITRNMPRTPKSPLDYITNSSQNSIFLSPFTYIEAEEIILNFDPAKSVGPHSIPIDLLKILGLHISQALAKLVNQYFLEGIFPSKLAKVVSLYKKPLILLITIFCSLNLNAIVSEEMPLDGLIHIFQIEPNMFQIVEPTLIV